MQKDIFSNVKIVQALAPIKLLADGDAAGIIIDTQDYDGGMLTVCTGVVTTGDVVIKQIEESDASNMASAAVIPAARLRGTIAAVTASAGSNSIGFYANKRYIKATFTGANTSVLLASAVVALGYAKNNPVNS